MYPYLCCHPLPWYKSFSFSDFCLIDPYIYLHSSFVPLVYVSVCFTVFFCWFKHFPRQCDMIFRTSVETENKHWKCRREVNRKFIRIGSGFYEGDSEFWSCCICGTKMFNFQNFPQTSCRVLFYVRETKLLKIPCKYLITSDFYEIILNAFFFLFPQEQTTIPWDSKLACGTTTHYHQQN